MSIWLHWEYDPWTFFHGSTRPPFSSTCTLIRVKADIKCVCCRRKTDVMWWLTVMVRLCSDECNIYCAPPVSKLALLSLLWISYVSLAVLELLAFNAHRWLLDWHLVVSSMKLMTSASIVWSRSSASNIRQLANSKVDGKVSTSTSQSAWGGSGWIPHKNWMQLSGNTVFSDSTAAAWAFDDQYVLVGGTVAYFLSSCLTGCQLKTIMTIDSHSCNSNQYQPCT